MANPQTQSSASNDNTTFYFFPRLPTEIRLEIWRASLPSRIIPIDSRRPCPGPSNDRIRIWQRLPSISHVCQEARAVAFEHGHLRWAENVIGPGNLWAKTWIDPSKDLIFIDTVTDLPNAIPEDIIDDHILLDAKQAKALVISWKYINFQDIEHTARLFDYLKDPFLYIAHKYVVHLSKQEAIDSGLFGYNAEETTVLVDYKDKDRLRAFYVACELTSNDLYVLKEHIDSPHDPADQLETVFEHAQGDFVRMWLRLRRHGIPKKGHAKDDPRYTGLYDQFGFLNYDHPLMTAAKKSVPKYRPMFIFELCQNSQHLLIMKHISNKKAFNSVCHELFLKKIYNADHLREYLSHNLLQ